jgi:deazaflavin-dependent oxidoreductase (nitroreductase family)
VLRAENPSGPRVSDEGGGVSLLGRLAIWGSQAANRRGLYLGRRSTRIHVAIYRRTSGRLGGHVPGLPSARVLLLELTGARSGDRRTSPVMYHEDGDAVAVMASKAGQPTHPAWFHNLIANPQTMIQIASEIRQVRARIATDDERARLWPRFATSYPGVDFFQRLAGARRIPILILDPLTDHRLPDRGSRNE